MVRRPTPTYLSIADEMFEVMPESRELRDYTYQIVIHCIRAHQQLESSGEGHRTADLPKAMLEYFSLAED